MPTVSEADDVNIDWWGVPSHVSDPEVVGNRLRKNVEDRQIELTDLMILARR
jgi:hypothetical protein